MLTEEQKKKNREYNKAQATEGIALAKERRAGVGMDKAAAVAGIAQSIGVAPQGGVAGGAISGAASGAAFGPAGAAIGGIAGGLMGGAAASAKAKAHNAALRAKSIAAQGKIEEEKGKNIANALNQMGARMSLR
jgi:hypothetical protein